MDEYWTELQELNRKIVEENIIIICIINFFVVSGFFGNTLSVYYFGFKERKNLNDVLISALCASNVMSNILAAVEQKKNTSYLTFTDEIGCKCHYFLTYSVIKLSAMILCLIAVNRQRWLCHPFSWQLTPKIITLSIVVAVLYSISSSFVQLMIAHVEQINITTNGEYGHGFRNWDSIDMTTDNTIRAENASIMQMSNATDGNETSIRTLEWVNMTLDCNRTEKNVKELDNTIEDNNTFPQLVHFKTEVNSTKFAQMEWLNHTNIYSRAMVAHVCTNMDKSNDSNSKLFQIFNFFEIAVTCGILVTIIYSYGSIAKVLFESWKKRKELQKDSFQKRVGKLRIDIKMTLMMVTLTALTILSFTPYFVVKSLLATNLVNSNHIRLRLISSSYMLNSVTDPYVLLAFIPNFRRFVKQIFCCWLYRKRNSESKR